MAYCVDNRPDGMMIVGQYNPNIYCPAIVLSPNEYQQFFNAQNQPYDFAGGFAYFGFSFAAILTLWLISHKLGILLHFIRKS